MTTGFIWNLPMIAPGDRLSAGIVYSEGAIGYAAVTPSGGATNTAYNRVNGNQVSYGMFQDAAYESVGLAASAVCGLNTGGGCGSIQLTTAWSASAAFEHLWTPALRTSCTVRTSTCRTTTRGNAIICNAGGGFYQAGLPAVTGCDTDWSAWNIGSRTQWEPVKGLIMGIDVIYNKQNTSTPNFAGIAPGAGVGLPATSVPQLQRDGRWRRRLRCLATGPRTRTPGPARSASSATSCPDRVSVTL